jgi:hypothetical protein
MRTSSSRLLLTALCLIAAGCAVRPAHDSHTAARDSICADAASNPLHLTSASTAAKPDVDSEIESLLTQPTADPRLAQINRHMYQALRALDVELRREQQLAACQQTSSEQLAAQSRDTPVLNPAPVSSVDGAGAPPSIGSVGQTEAGSTLTAGPAAAAGSEGKSATAHATSSVTSNPASSTFGSSRSALKARLPRASGGGNGATAPNVVPGSDDDIVARRLRKAAEQETDPTLRARLWKEYTAYKEGTSAK